MVRVLEKAAVVWAWLSFVLLFSAVGAVIGFLVMKGGPSLNIPLIFGDTNPLDAILMRRAVYDGIFPAIIGTLVLVVLAIMLAAPLGILTGIYMAEYASARAKKLLGFFFDILAGLPSILVGLFGLAIAIFLHKYVSDRIATCLLLSALSLAFLVLPYLIRATQSALENVPPDIRRTAPAFGASRVQNLFWVLLPHARSGMLNGIILSIGRCAEDTAVIMLTGVVAVTGLPQSIWAQYEALPFYIYYISAQYSDQQELMMGYGAALTLLCLCAFLFLFVFYVNHRFRQRAMHRI